MVSRFANPEWFLLLAFIPILLWFWKKKRKTTRLALSLPLPKHLRGFDPDQFSLLFRGIALVFFVIALARPQHGTHHQNRSVEGIDIVITLDVSASMKIEDLADRSRMEIAKETIDSFIRGRSNDRIGLTVFSGEPLTLVPPTLDYELVLQSLRDVGFGILKDGTAIGDGLSVSVSHLRNSDAKSRVIILLTDGDNNVGQIDPGTAGELAKGYGIRVYTIAIGREGRVKLPIDQTTPFGTKVRTYQWFDNALNPELLKHIAESTHGKFYRVTDENALSAVFREIDKLERTEIKTNDRVQYHERFIVFLNWGLVFLALEVLIGRFLWRRVT